jgi:hypothetical protein
MWHMLSVLGLHDLSAMRELLGMLKKCCKILALCHLWLTFLEVG